MTFSPSDLRDTWGSVTRCDAVYDSLALLPCRRQTRRHNQRVQDYCIRNQFQYWVQTPRKSMLTVTLPQSKRQDVVVHSKSSILQLSFRPDAVLIESLVCYYPSLIISFLQSRRVFFIQPRQQLRIQLPLCESEAFTISTKIVAPAHEPMTTDLMALYVDMDLEMDLWYGHVYNKCYIALYQCKRTKLIYCCCPNCPQTFTSLDAWKVHYDTVVTLPGQFIRAYLHNGQICGDPHARLQTGIPQTAPVQDVLAVLQEHGYAWRTLGDQKHGKQYAEKVCTTLKRL